ncbi:MAG: SpoIIE family protein phosphatase [Acidobacteria bacterium]|nr:SpoIIE family protein phosphatase [Acidobacteriota bacterium]
MPLLFVQQANGMNYEVAVQKVRTTIGRSSRNDICLNDPFASRVHAEVRRENESFFITDMGSANGTYHNGIRMSGTLPLLIGDIIRIGETQIHFRESDSTGSYSANILLSDADWTTAPEATIMGRSGANKKDSLLTSVISEMAGRDRLSDKTGILTPQLGVLDKQRDLLAVVSKVVETLLSERSLDETLKLILDLVFDAVAAERGYIFLTSPTGELLLKAARTKTGNTDQLVNEEVKISRSIIDTVLSECTSVLTSDAQQDPRFSQRNSIMLSNIRSIMAVPLAHTGDEVLGMIYVDSHYGTSRFSQEDLGVITTIARVSAIKIDNVRLMEEQLEKRRIDEELKVASEIQLSLHPARQPKIDGYDVMGISFPCREIGGDYYDFIQCRDRNWIVAVGDVSGKGIGAALMMSSLHASLRAQAQTGRPVEDIVSEVNAYITENSPENKFLTLFCGELCPPTGTMTYASAGHNAALLVRADKSVEELGATGLPAGITVDFPYESEQIVIDPGDILVIYSDGVTEGVNEHDELFGEQRLIEVIRRHNHANASQLRDRIDEALSHFVGKEPQADDMTLVVLKRLR